MKDFVLCLTPMRDEAHPATAWCLAHRMDGFDSKVIFVVGLQVAEARNKLASLALELFRDRDDVICIWVDDDAFWEPGTVQKLVRALQKNPHLDVVAGAFTTRGLPYSSLTATDKTGWIHFIKPAQAATVPERAWRQPAGVFSGWSHFVVPARGEIMPIHDVGMHFTAHRLSLLERLGPNPFTPLQASAAGYPGDHEMPEDHSFFVRFRKLGGKAALVTGAIVGHLDGEICYLPCRPPMRLHNLELRSIPDGTVITPGPSKWQNLPDRQPFKVEREVERFLPRIASVITPNAKTRESIPIRPEFLRRAPFEI